MIGFCNMNPKKKTLEDENKKLDELEKIDKCIDVLKKKKLLYFPG